MWLEDHTKIEKLKGDLIFKISNGTNRENQRKACFPSGFLLMSDGVSMTTRSQHLSLKSGA